jgi:hypothetical protein
MRCATLPVAWLAVLATVGCGPNSTHEAGRIVQADGAPQTTVEETPFPCSLVDLAHESDLLLHLSVKSPPAERELRYWRGDHTEAEVTALPPATVELSEATVLAMTSRRETGPSVGALPHLGNGAEVTLVWAGPISDDAESVAPPGADIEALATVWNSTSGLLVRIVAVVDERGEQPVVVAPEACAKQLNHSLDRLESRDEIFSRMVMEAFTSTDLDSQLSVADTEPSPTAEQQLAAYEDWWSTLEPTSRPLQLGSIPPSLEPNVQVAGLYFEAANVSPDLTTTLVLWSEMGTSYEVVIGSGSGPAPIVIPRVGRLFLSERLLDGTLGAPLARVDVQDLEGETTIGVAFDREANTAELSGMTRSEYANLMGSTEESLELLEVSYKAALLYRPNPEADGAG